MKRTVTIRLEESEVEYLLGSHKNINHGVSLSLLRLRLIRKYTEKEIKKLLSPKELETVFIVLTEIYVDGDPRLSPSVLSSYFEDKGMGELRLKLSTLTAAQCETLYSMIDDKLKGSTTIETDVNQK
jgi:hypothetical protein